MSILTRVAGLAAGTVRSVTLTVNALTGGLQIRTDDVPVSVKVVATFALDDVRRWIAANLNGRDEPVKIAVVRESHAQLWKLTIVVLNQRNKRCFDSDGRLRAQAHLVRNFGADLEEILAGRNSILLTP